MNTNILHPYSPGSLRAIIIAIGILLGMHVYGQSTIPGDNMQNPIEVGTFDSDFQYSDTKDTEQYSDSYPSTFSENDVYHRFTLTRQMQVTMTHCMSGIMHTTMYLLDVSGTIITDFKSDYYDGEGACISKYMAFIQRSLAPGTYYIVSEGLGQNGEININISGHTTEFDYPEAPSTYSTDPEGVGSVTGAFDVSATGAATYSMPIKCPPGVGGLQPQVAISYNSQAGNGLVGWGCNISGISAITRVPKSIHYDDRAAGIDYEPFDAFVLDGQRLICETTPTGGKIYYLESDPFTKITVKGTYSSSKDDTWFEVITRDGMIYRYGSATGKQIYNAISSFTGSNMSKVNIWYLDHVEDPMGNYMDYTYTKTYSQYYENLLYLTSITYGKNTNAANTLENTVTFTYESRPDIIPFYLEYRKGEINQRLSKIVSKTGNEIFREYDLRYSYSIIDHFSRLTFITEKNGAGESLKPTIMRWRGIPSFSQACTLPSVTANGTDFVNYNYLSGDFNGDGITDIATIRDYDIANKQVEILYGKINNGTVSFQTDNSFRLIMNPSTEFGYYHNHLTSDFNGDGITDFYIPVFVNGGEYYQSYFNIYAYESFNYLLKGAAEHPLHYVADINNDGKDDFLILEKNKNNTYYHGEIITYNSTDNGYVRKPVYVTLPKKPEKMFVADFNGDGLKDVCVFYEGGHTLFTQNINRGLLSDGCAEHYTHIGDCKMISMGDFNGDGLPDFLMNETNSNRWDFAINGSGGFTKQFACTLDIYDQDLGDSDNDEDEFECHVFDFDYDGKTDVVIIKAMYDMDDDIWSKPWGVFRKTHAYWMKSTGYELTQVGSATSNDYQDALNKNYLTGDFDGDGRIELINYGYNCINSESTRAWRMYKNPSMRVDNGMVTSITAGAGSSTDITYAPLIGGGIYTKGTGAAFPVIDITPPMPVVKKVVSDNGAAGSTTVNYTYEGAKLHRQGKGFLGMTLITAENVTTGVTTKSGIKSWNNTFHVPTETWSETTVDGKTAKSTTMLTIADKGAKKFFAFPNQKTEIDLDNNTYTTTYRYDEGYGDLTEEKTEYGNSMYRTVQYSDFVVAGGRRQPKMITTAQKHTDDSEFVRQTYLTYHSGKGYAESKIENYGTPKPLTTEYTGYDDYGNCTSYRVTGSGLNTITYHTSYDATNRLAAHTYTEPASTVAACTYDTWGNVLTKTDATNPANPLTTTYSYNGWGQRTSAESPDGVKTTYHTGWDNQYNSKRYFTLVQGDRQPWVKTWYDCTGRETAMKTIGPGGMSISVSHTYNSKGQLTQTQSQKGDMTVTDDFTYDGRGRLQTENSSNGKSLSYSYDNRTQITTDNGRRFEKTFDAWGNIKSSTDPAGSVSYTYHSTGKPKSITAAGAIFTMTYDSAGYQKTLKDPNAGTFTYTYDAAGRIWTQKDGRGNKLTNQYDALNRLEYSLLEGAVNEDPRPATIRTDYTYGSQDNELHRLLRITTSGNYIAWTYDQYGRTETETRQIEGEDPVVTSFSYINGQLQETTYPGGVEVKHEYDAYGNLVKVLAGTQPVWEFTTATGTTTTAKLGGTMTTTTTLTSQGLLSNLKTVAGSAGLRNMDFVFDAPTGNLTSRTGMITEKETFEYDSLARLTKVHHGTPETLNLSMIYAANGNISYKNDLGKYRYHPTKKHAVENTDNDNGIIKSSRQAIGYNAFNKALWLTDTVDNNAYQLDITYGPDQQRCKTVLIKDGYETKKIIFAGEYEKVTENGVTQQLYYITGGDGLAAVYVRQAGVADQIYYAHTDHLGSIVSMTDGNATEVFKATYDAWGKQTITKNTFKFHRGYTGHEHLPEFGLINMNGRMYDPIVGRFLSPDPFVQAPEFSQSFNRYSYCWNNPLAYTDPSGEFIFSLLSMWLAPPLVPAAMQLDWAWMSTLMNTASNGGNMKTAVGNGLTSGLMNAGLSFLNVPGMIPNGLIHAGGNVLNNGISNSIYGNDFFDGWEWQAAGGFAGGAYSGYELVKESKGKLNYWWGGEVAERRTQWSFFNSDLPSEVIDFNINGNLGSKKKDDCVPSSFVESDNRLGGNRSYDYFVQYSGYKDDVGVALSPSGYERLVARAFGGRVTSMRSLQSNEILLNTDWLRHVAESGGVVNVHFRNHSDVVRMVKLYQDAAKNTIVFRSKSFSFSKILNLLRSQTDSGRIINVFHIFK